MLCAGVALAAFAYTSVASAEENVEVLHWWTSGGEAAALNTLKETLAKQGVNWTDMPVAGGAGTNAMTVLKARVTAGNPPTAVQLLGFDIRDWAQTGTLADLSSLAKEQGWDKLIWPATKQFSTYDGKWIAVPVNVHSSNWVWISKAAMDKIGLAKPPANWDELIAALELAKKAGIVPLAHGGQPWQDTTIFENVVLSTGGLDFYRKALIELDPKALGSDTMKTVFDRMTALKGYFDPNFSGRAWNLASAMVIKGDALMQVMGDWAKGEFVNAKQVPQKDFLCIRFPGTQGEVLNTGDQFSMFKSNDPAVQDAERKLALAIMDPQFQITFNKIKGSIPARMDIPDTQFDDCAKKAIADMKEATANNAVQGSLAHGHAATAAIKNAIFDVVTRQLNGQLTSHAAVAELVSAVASAK